MIVPGAVWNDTSGKPIQAHGGGIVRYRDAWYWFGEDRSRDLQPGTLAARGYRSTDLVHWQDMGRALSMTEPEEWKSQYGNKWQLERPKVFVPKHPKAGAKFVMYVHLDAAYKAAEVGVAVSDKIEGPYRLVSHFRPLGQESRDIGQFVDDDGTNYLVFESRPTKGFFIAKLSDDAQTVAAQTAFILAPLEGGTVVHADGLYYAIGSHMTGWKPNPDVYATAKSIAGPWTEFKDIAPPEANTYGAQSSALVKVTSADKKHTAVIFVGDLWKPQSLWDSRYLWMPVTLENGAMHLPAPQPWTIDVRTASVTLGQGTAPAQ